MEMYTERQAYDPSRDIAMLVSEPIQILMYNDL